MKIFIVSLTIVSFLGFFRVAFFLFSPKPLISRNFPKTAFVRLNQPTNLIDQAVKKLYPEPQASLLSGILVGTKANMSKDFYNSLQRTGTLHIIALSGTNITLLISFFDLLFKPVGKRRSSFLSIFAIIVFILFVGLSASVVRAGIMGSLNLIAILFGRRNIAIFSLILAALVMVIISPQIIIDIGFQLSFLATVGIILLNRNYENSKSPFKKALNFLKSELKLTLSAQLFTLPVILFNFHSLSLISPLSNILVGWTIPYLMAGGFLISIVSLAERDLVSSDLISKILSWFLLPLLNWFIWVINTTASFGFASVKIL